MDINSAFPSNYLRASDLAGREAKVVISHVQMENLGSDEKPVLYFRGKERGLVLNKTNANSIASMYGADTDSWHGNEIVIFPSQTDFQGKSVPCIRVRIQDVKQPAVAPQDDDIPF